MIKLLQAGLRGTTVRGAFAGRLKFSPGVQVIHGRNNYGKSLAATAATWCLGLEPMYGLQRNDPALFSDAVRTQLFYPEDEPVEVLSSEAFLEVQVGDQTISLRRAIVGSDARLIEATLRSTGETHNLIAGSLVDQSGGFQATFFRWAGWPVAQVMTAKGSPSAMYIENLAPLFFLEQREGWSDIQGLQLVKYKQLEVAEASVEYLLGLKNRLSNRFRRQQAELFESKRKEEFIAWTKKVETLAASHGWKASLVARLSLEDLANRYRAFDIRRYFQDNFAWEYAREFERLSSEVGLLQKRLNTSTVPKERDIAAREVSSRVVVLKNALHDKQEQVDVLRKQIASQGALLETMKARLQAASDLARLKESNIGIFESAVCPTCQSRVEPEKFDLHPQSLGHIKAYIETAKRDEDALRNATNAASDALQRLLIEILETEQAFVAAQRAMKLINEADNPVAEAVAVTASRILELEREIERTKGLEGQLLSLQEELQNWLAQASTLDAVVDGHPIAVESSVVDAFEERFKQYLQEVGHGDALRLMNEVHLDEHYVPRVKTRRLRQLGSASDQPRLVLAYAWALMETSLDKGGWHPGFLLADEPLQQNPDKRYREAWCKFIAAQVRRGRGQAIILTALQPEELAFLKQQAVPVEELKERHLLQPL